MTAAAPEGLRRILVAIDPSPHGRAAVEMAARLAALLEAELEGLYVEDERLLRLEGIGRLREVDSVSGRVRRLRAGDVERQLRAEAATVRRILASVGSRFGVHWTFRVARGRVDAKVREAAAGSDLVTLGIRSRTAGRGPGSTVRALVAGRERPVMIIRRGMRLRPDVHVLDDGSEEGRRAVEVGERLTRPPGSALTVHVAGEGDAERRAERVDAVRRRLGARGRSDAQVLEAPEEPRGPAAILSRRHCGLLIVPRTQVSEDEGDLERLLGRAGCPVLVVG
ncbi:MAG TPA: universal stress protein [Longimicrobiales bacterium]|nr:universal stress protein [Longimicrobiales bacterium]